MTVTAASITSSAHRSAARFRAADLRPTDSVLVVTDGGSRAEWIVRQSVNSDHGVVVIGALARDVTPFLDARFAGRVWPVVVDPSNPELVADVIRRAGARVGPVQMIIDPAGRLADVDAADSLIA